jgi:hypothetical protein
LRGAVTEDLARYCAQHHGPDPVLIIKELCAATVADASDVFATLSDEQVAQLWANVDSHPIFRRLARK